MRHSFTNPDRCVAGTIGAPGERAFFVQARSANRVVSVAVEKAQVQAVANRLELMIAEVRKANPLVVIETLPADDAGRFLSGVRRRGDWSDNLHVAVYGDSPRALLGTAHVKAGELIPGRLLSPLEIQSILEKALA